MNRLGVIGFQPLVFHLGPVNTQLPVLRIILKQRFDAPALVPIRGGGPQILLGHRITRPILHSARSENPPGHDNAVGTPFLGRRNQPVETAVAKFDAQEFIRVEHHYPIACPDQRLILGIFDRRWLRAQASGDIVDPVIGQPHFFKPHQHLVGTVGAVIGVDDNIGEPDRQMMGDPFQQERPFILHHRHGGDPAMGALARGQPIGKRHIFRRRRGSFRLLRQNLFLPHLFVQRSFPPILDTAKPIGHYSRKGKKNHFVR